MNTKLITVIIVVVALVALIAYDLVVNFNRMEGDTISEVVGSVFQTTPILAMVLGVVVGHLVSSGAKLTPLLTFISQWPLIPLLCGIPMGFLFWNMGRS